MKDCSYQAEEQSGHQGAWQGAKTMAAREGQQVCVLTKQSTKEREVRASAGTDLNRMSSR